jgi:hypothetical protein
MADSTINELTVNNNLSAVNYIPISNGVDTTRLGSNSLFGTRNRLINGGFNIAQRGTTISGVSGDYVLDRWRLVASETTAITVDQLSDPYAGANNSMRVANGPLGKRFGVYQIIESANCKDLRGKQVTLSFKVKTSDNSIPAPIAISIIEYTGTADSVQNGIFSSMNVNAIPVVRTAGGFTANYQAAITPSLPVTWYSVPPITTTLGSSFNNLLIALTWMNSTNPNSLNKNFELAQVQLEEGPTATPFEFRPISTELAMCQRYYDKSYPINVAPGTATSNGMVVAITEVYLGSAWYSGGGSIKLSQEMRRTPDFSYYDSGGTISRFSSYWNGSVGFNINPAITLYANTKTIGILEGAGGPEGGRAGSPLVCHYTANAEL